MTLPDTILSSKLWQQTLAVQRDDPNSSQRERLRSVFTQFRERVGHLAAEIRRDIPDLTVHDLTHLDALWEVASLIVGEDFSLTPTEAFVLGGAILLHDLAMSLSATPGGYSALKSDRRWRDLVTYEYREALGRDPSLQEILEPEATIRQRALLSALRLIHAENAEKLAFVSFRSADGGELHLIEDSELRQTFGSSIGRIAHSHWWSVSKLEDAFTRVIGAPHWCPAEWKVDALKLACILRVADAAHLDARRAPMFLKSVVVPSKASEPHWRFQEKLNKPYPASDTLVFTSGGVFRLADATAWWLCLETLRMVDRELRSVDALLADRNLPRFATRRVAGVDLPERLAEYVRTDGWLPINATIHVTDLPSVVASLGGSALYGNNRSVALRELVQNACDAVRARRLYEGRPPSYGSISVSLTNSDGHHWLEVKDTGTGMSQRVLTEFLLDFGRSFWGSAAMHEEFPGLLAAGLVVGGKFGIGFFSVFMIADFVEVTSRRADAAARDTLILEFSSGLRGRPILRPANEGEQLLDGGTRVRLRLKASPTSESGLLYRGERKSPASLTDLCLRLCPAVDVDLYVCEGERARKIIGASDWKDVNEIEFLSRFRTSDWFFDRESEDFTQKEGEFQRRAAQNLRLLTDDNGEIYGRACITIGAADHFEQRIDVEGVVAIGGLRACSLTGICGILLGYPLRASRDAARPSVPLKALSKWADEQVALIPSLWPDPKQQAACAQNVRLCGGRTGDLPIALHKGQWVSAVTIVKDMAKFSEVVIVDHFTLNQLSVLAALRLDDSVIVTNISSISPLLQAGGHHGSEWPDAIKAHGQWANLWLGVTLGGAVVEALASAWDVKVDALTPKGFGKDVNAKVGVDGEREIRTRGFIVKRPAD